MKNSKSTVLLFILSIFSIVCSMWNVIWRVVKFLILFSDKAHDLIGANYDLSVIFSQNNMSVSLVMNIFNSFLIGVIAFFQFVCAIAGLIYSGFMLGGKKLKFSGIPLIFGIFTTLMGFISIIILAFSEISQLGLVYAIMCFSLFIFPLLYTVASAAFMKAIPVENKKEIL